jgi:hypothetical protein
MSQAPRPTTTAAHAASALLAAAVSLLPVSALGQTADVPADAQPPEPAPPLAAQPAPAPAPLPAPPPALPPPSARAHGYPFAFRPRPEPEEASGPVLSWAPLRFAVAFESRTTWLLDDGAKRLAGKTRPTGMGVGVQADLRKLQENVVVRLDLGWVGTSGSQYRSDAMVTEQLKSNLFSLGVAVRYHVWRWLAPFARLSGGLGWDKLTVADLHDRQVFGNGAVGAGLFLRSPGVGLWQGSSALFLGLSGSIEAGYAVASGSDFVLTADNGSSSETPIPTSQVPLGHVGRSAPYVRASVGLAF